jgi:hypothetical protein
MGAPNDQHELIVHTNENALLQTGQNWDVSVEGQLTEYVRGTVTETYDSNKTEQVKSAVKETYLSFQSTKVSDRRAADYGSFRLYVHGISDETHQGNHVTQSWAKRTIEVGGTHEETSHAGRTTTVIGDWDQNVSGHAKINGAQVTVKTGAFKCATGPSVELFTSKNAAGAQKLDVTGVKLEFTDAAIARTAFKLDSVGIKIENTGAKLVLGPEVKSAPISLKSIAVCIGSFGFKKL